MAEQPEVDWPDRLQLRVRPRNMDLSFCVARERSHRDRTKHFSISSRVKYALIIIDASTGAAVLRGCIIHVILNWSAAVCRGAARIPAEAVCLVATASLGRNVVNRQA